MAWSKRFHKPGDPEEGYYFDIGTFVCRNHFDDSFLNNHIKSEGQKGFCSYCGRKSIVTELESVLEIIALGIEFVYEDPANSRYYNKDTTYGYDGNIMPFSEMWWDDPFDLRIENDKLLEDVFDQLETDQLYCLRDEFGSHEDFLHDLWNHFKSVLKHKARFAFHFSDVFKKWNLSNPADILHQVEYAILRNNMITELPESSKLYRTRQHKWKDEIQRVDQMASLPNFLNKTAGRMNAAGISLFYCSQNRQLTIDEVVGKRRSSKPYYTTSIFYNKEQLRLVDLTKLPDIPSVFDSQNNRFRDIIFFLKTFMTEISQPVKVKDSILEYLPTQVITEYLRYNTELNVQGIIYWSSKSVKEKNIVLFFDHEDSLENLNFDLKSLRTYLVKSL
jgi:DNA-directed RNA polymerase subunit N (RpoN/RPB10)